MMHLCVDKLTIIGSDNGLSPGRRQAIIWNYNIFIQENSLKVSSVEGWPFCHGLNVLSTGVISSATQYI